MNGQFDTFLNGVQVWAVDSGMSQRQCMVSLVYSPCESRASMHAFQEQARNDTHNTTFEPVLSHSSISSYLGIDKRDGLSSMAKHLLESQCTSHLIWHGIHLVRRLIRYQCGSSSSEMA